MAAGLTPKQARFVDEFIVDLNATQAAIRAGYSAKTANQSGPRLLVNVGVAAAIAKRQAKVSAKAELTAESHIAKLEELRDAALKAEQFAAAITAETKRGEVAGLYIKRREDVTKLSPAERAERVKRVLKLA